MDAALRSTFNNSFSQQHYDWYQRELSRRLDCPFEFRVAESPVFLTDDFKTQVVDAARAIVEQLSHPERLAEMKAAIPERWNAPRMDALPNFTQVDFAVVRED